MITQEKWRELRKKMEGLGIREEDLVEKFILGSGSGGQKINKTSSCIYLKHIPTGIEVKCQQERSREMNRFIARRKLCNVFEERTEKGESERAALIHKIRKQKRRRSRKAKEKMLDMKKRHSKTKELRRPPP